MKLRAPSSAPRSGSSAATAIHAGMATSVANSAVHAINIGRDAALALAFGTSAALDAFFLAMMLPVFLATVGVGAYRNAIVPALERLIHATGLPQTTSLIRRIFSRNLLILLSVGLVLAITAPLYSPLLSGRLQPDSYSLLTTLSWAVLPMTVVSAAAGLAEGPLQTLGSFFWPAFFRGALPLGIALGALTLGPTYGVLGACYGGAVGAVVQLLGTWALLRNQSAESHLPREQVDQVNQDIRQQFGLLSAGVAIAYISPLIDQWMASFLGAGAVSILSYANRLIVGAASLAASALSPGLLPHFSRLAARGETAQLNKHYLAAVRMTWWIGIVLAGLTWLFSEPFVVLLYEHGQFTREDSLAVAHIVGWFCLQFPPMLAGIAGSAMLSACGQNRVFLPLSALIAVVNVAGNLCLMPFYGLAGIALSTVITYLVSLMTINAMLVRKELIRPPWTLLRDGGISVVTGLILVLLILKEDAKLAAIPTGSQITLSALALGMFGLVALYCTKEVLVAIRRTA